jgi:hypothetical protein
VVGSPTHAVMPNLVMLWKMGPSRCGRRAGGYSPLAGAASGRGTLRRPPGGFPCDLTGRRWPGAGGGESTSHTPLPPLSRGSTDISPTADAMRVYPRYCASRGGQCASRVLLGGLGGQLLTEWWEVGYITRMCPFRHCSRHMQQISGQYRKIVFFFYPLINALCS